MYIYRSTLFWEPSAPGVAWPRLRLRRGFGLTLCISLDEYFYFSLHLSLSFSLYISSIYMYIYRSTLFWELGAPRVTWSRFRLPRGFGLPYMCVPRCILFFSLDLSLYIYLYVYIIYIYVHIYRSTLFWGPSAPGVAWPRLRLRRGFGLTLYVYL